VLVVVTDTGPGMTPEEAENIFDRYYRGGEARTRTPHGTGLGLPISRAIARAHGGDLTVHSVPGGGSTFTLRLGWPEGKRLEGDMPDGRP
jgi:two-component system OmpR family sensor kinase